MLTICSQSFLLQYFCFACNNYFLGRKRVKKLAGCSLPSPHRGVLDPARWFQSVFQQLPCTKIFMHLLDWSLRECFSSFKTVYSSVLTYRQKNKHCLRLSEQAIIYTQWSCFKRKDCMHPSKKGLEDVVTKDEDRGHNSLTHQHHSQDPSPGLDSLADHSP